MNDFSGWDWETNSGEARFRVDEPEKSRFDKPKPKCPKCGASLRRIEKGRAGPWYGCNRWRETNCSGSMTEAEYKQQEEQ